MRLPRESYSNSYSDPDSPSWYFFFFLLILPNSSYSCEYSQVVSGQCKSQAGIEPRLTTYIASHLNWLLLEVIALYTGYYTVITGLGDSLCLPKIILVQHKLTISYSKSLSIISSSPLFVRRFFLPSAPMNDSAIKYNARNLWQVMVHKSARMRGTTITVSYSKSNK